MQRARAWSDASIRRKFEDPSHDRGLFYMHVGSEGRHFERRYGPLRVALTSVRQVLATHPALEDAVDPSSNDGELCIQILASEGVGYLTMIVGGLMARAAKLPGNGHLAAATEFQGMLEADVEQQPADPGDLSVGYHAALLHGLRLDKEIPLGDDACIVPFGRLEGFIDRQLLRDLIPDSVLSRARRAMAAVVRQFRWQPEFRRKSLATDPELDWGSTFLEDAEDLIQLLAVYHESPVVCLARIPFCIPRAASQLLGQFHHGSYDWGRSVRGYDLWHRSKEGDPHAIDQAWKAVAVRDSQRYKACAPMIARLAEALSRSGQFRVDDQILDVAIALERMYELPQGEIQYKLKTRAACYLASDSKGRREVFDDVGALYNARSSIVHNKRRRKGKRKRKKEDSAQAKAEAFAKGFVIGRRTIVKLLESGSPEDWNDIVIGSEDIGRTPSNEVRTELAGTTIIEDQGPAALPQAPIDE